jgi:hypothetical protein
MPSERHFLLCHGVVIRNGRCRKAGRELEIKGWRRGCTLFERLQILSATEKKD